MDYQGPPVRLNRGFLDETANRFKLVEITLGICCAVLNSYCFPNSLWLMCTYRIHTFPQIFSVICVNIFFIFITTILAFCNLFGVNDAFYKYNFPMLEKFLMSLATLMYAVSSVLLLVALFTSQFIASWLVPVFFTLWTLATYGYDAHQRWKYSDRI